MENVIEKARGTHLSLAPTELDWEESEIGHKILTFQN